MPITWESAGTEEPGDQWGTSAWPGGEWLIGPNGNGTWGVTHIVREEDGQVGAEEYHGAVKDEDAAKAMAQALEDEFSRSLRA